MERYCLESLTSWAEEMPGRFKIIISGSAFLIKALSRNFLKETEISRAVESQIIKELQSNYEMYFKIKSILRSFSSLVAVFCNEIKILADSFTNLRNTG